MVRVELYYVAVPISVLLEATNRLMNMLNICVGLD